MIATLLTIAMCKGFPRGSGSDNRLDSPSDDYQGVGWEQCLLMGGKCLLVNGSLSVAMYVFSPYVLVNLNLTEAL